MDVQIGSAYSSFDAEINRNSGPYRYGDNLFCVLYSVESFAGSIGGILRAFKSDDDGATWTPNADAGVQVGPEDGVGNSRLPYDLCLDRSGRYLYVCFINTSQKVAVTRFDMQAEAWAAGTETGPDYGTLPARVAIQQLDNDDTLYVIANLRNRTVSGDVYLTPFVMTVDFGGAGFSSETELTYSGGTYALYVDRLVRGDSGKMHAFLHTRVFTSGDDGFLFHCDVSSSTTLDVIRTCSSDRNPNYVAGASAAQGGGGRKLLLLFNESQLGSDDNEVFWALADSASSPSFTFTSLGAGNNFTHGLPYYQCIADGDGFRLAYDLKPFTDGEVMTRWLASGGLQSAVSVITDAALFEIPGMGFTLSGGVALLLGRDEHTSGGERVNDVWFFTGSGADQALVGAAGIPSAEQFGVTSGLRGGGQEECGPVVPPNPTDPNCQPADPVAPPVSTYRCGYALAL